jgi:hypothetical protein
MSRESASYLPGGRWDIQRSSWENAIITEVRIDGSGGDQPTVGYFPRRRPNGDADEELAQLRSLLASRVVEVGPRGSARTADALDSIVDSIRSEPIDVQAFGPVMQALARNRDLVQALTTLDSFDELMHLVTLGKRRRALEKLREHAADPTSTADSMMDLLTSQWWVFGGNLALMPSAWRIPALPERCLPLVRFDGAVHLVLVESPHIDVVTPRADGAYGIDQAVWNAFDRARHLVGLLQDQREQIEQQLTFRSSRASVSVVIGYPTSHGLSRMLVRDKVRELNTFTHGFAVVTYDELINIAQETLPSPE